MLQELNGHHGADGVASQVFCTGGTATVPVEAGDRIGAARLELASKDISIDHGSSIAQRTAVIGGTRPPPTRGSVVAVELAAVPVADQRQADLEPIDHVDALKGVDMAA